MVIGIQDFGVRISPEEQNRVLKRFFRVNSPHGRKFAGLGLGLYVSSEIVKRHGGDIRIESTKGHGSTFFVRLPTKKTKKFTT